MGFIDDYAVDIDELRKSRPEPLEIWIGIIRALVEGDQEAGFPGTPSGIARPGDELLEAVERQQREFRRVSIVEIERPVDRLVGNRAEGRVAAFPDVHPVAFGA